MVQGLLNLTQQFGDAQVLSQLRLLGRRIKVSPSHRISHCLQQDQLGERVEQVPHILLGHPQVHVTRSQRRQGMLPIILEGIEQQGAEQEVPKHEYQGQHNADDFQETLLLAHREMLGLMGRFRGQARGCSQRRVEIPVPQWEVRLLPKHVIRPRGWPRRRPEGRLLPSDNVPDASKSSHSSFRNTSPRLG